MTSVSSIPRSGGTKNLFPPSASLPPSHTWLNSSVWWREWGEQWEWDVAIWGRGSLDPCVTPSKPLCLSGHCCSSSPACNCSGRSSAALCGECTGLWYVLWDAVERSYKPPDSSEPWFCNACLVTVASSAPFQGLTPFWVWGREQELGRSSGQQASLRLSCLQSLLRTEWNRGSSRTGPWLLKPQGLDWLCVSQFPGVWCWGRGGRWAG